MPITDIANRYFAAVKARDAETYGSLFADDAVMTFPDGFSATGPDAIGARVIDPRP